MPRENMLGLVDDVRTKIMENEECIYILDLRKF